MPTLSPQATFSVNPESPVDKGPTMFQGVAGLVGKAFDIGADLRDAQASSGDDDDDANLEAGLIAGLQQAQALRDSGKEQEALQMERRIRINYSVAGGDLNKGRTKELITSYTGESAETLGFSPDEMAQRQMMDPSTELGKQFQSALVASYAKYPDGSLTEEQRYQVASDSVAMAQANQVRMDTATFEFNEEHRAAFGESIRAVEKTLVGAVALRAKNGGFVSLEDVQAAKAQFLSFKSEITARLNNLPEGVDTTQVIDHLKSVEEQLNYWEELAGPDNLDANATANLMRAVQEMPGVSTVDKDWLTRLVKADPSIVAHIGTMPYSKLARVLHSMQASGGTDITVVQDPGTWEPTAPIDAATGKEMTPVQNFEVTKDTFELFNQPRKTLSSNADAREAWSGGIHKALSGLHYMNSQGDYLEGREWSQMFNEGFFRNLEQIKQADPSTYNALLTKTRTVLTEAGLRLEKEINSRAEGTGLRFNQTTKSFEVDPAQAMEGVPEKLRSIVDRTVEENYDGDWELAFQDRGKMFPRDSEEYKAWTWVSQARRLDGASEKLAGLGVAIGDLMDLNDRLTSIDPAAMRADPTNPNSTASKGRMYDLIDRTEGGGSYDTLYGHSQRAGAKFHGVNVSQMTIGEIKQFTNTSGAYGQWVKANNPRGVVATPIGRYQFVGTTLKQLAADMGLSDDVVFTPEVQDAMFHYHAKNTIQAANSPADARARMRAQWEGFKYVSNKELDAAIAEFMGQPAPGYTTKTRDTTSLGGRGMPVNPDLSLDMGEGTGEGGAPAQAGAEAASGVSVEQGDVPASSDPTETGTVRGSGTGEQGRTASQAATEDMRARISTMLGGKGAELVEGMTDEEFARFMEIINSAEG